MHLEYSQVFFLFVVMAGMRLWLTIKANRLLKRSHKEVWESLGEPGKLSLGIKNELKIQVYMLLRRYRNLADKRLTMLGDVGLVLDALLIVFVIWLAVLSYRH